MKRAPRGLAMDIVSFREQAFSIIVSFLLGERICVRISDLPSSKYCILSVNVQTPMLNNGFHMTRR
jgi:hypothetical protein